MEREGCQLGVIQGAKCRNCGAPVPLKAGEVIITCDYCGTAFNVATNKDFILAHSIIPARFDEKEARDSTKRWMSSGSLKPSNLASASRISNMNMTFLPFYIVHTNITTEFKGIFTRTGTERQKEGKLHREYYWKVLGRRGSKFPTKEYEIPLSGKDTFNLSKIPSYAKFLNAEFDEKDAEDVARMEIMDHQKFLLSDQIDRFDSLEHDFVIEDIEFVHAPIWKVDFIYGKTDYQLLMCASTGDVIRGDIPPPDESVKGFLSDIKKAMFG